MDERGDQVGVVELDGQFLEDVGVAHVRLLEAAIIVSIHVVHVIFFFRIFEVIPRTPRK